MARSQLLVQEKVDDIYISEKISDISNHLTTLVSPEEVGAALERTGRMDKALVFYETVFKGKKWGSNKNTEHNAKERWLKCKQRQAEFDHKDAERQQKRFSEVKTRSVEWSILFPNEDYPTLDKLDFDSVDDPFEIVDKTTTEQQDEINDEILLSSTSELITSEQKSIITESRDKNISPLVLTSRSWSDNARFEFKFKAGNVDLTIMLLSKKRRIEIRNKNDDSVTIHVSEQDIESRDIELNRDSNNWQIEDWSLNITFTEISQEAKLVDFFDNNGYRILCVLA